jgi:hypothetical protein
MGIGAGFACSTADDSAADAPHRCAGDANPGTIEDAVAWMAALPAPVDAPCIVAGLARPLRVEGTTGIFSAQPAAGEDSPRVFLETGDPSAGTFRLSLVGSGSGAPYIEFGEYAGPEHSRKGELPLPVDPLATAQAAFDQVTHPEWGTRCAMCHTDTSPDPRGGEISIAIRPTPCTEVDVAALRALADECGGSTSARCDLLRTLAAGDMEDAPSPEEWPTIYEL